MSTTPFRGRRAQSRNCNRQNGSGRAPGPEAPQARGARPERVCARGGGAPRGSAYFVRRVDDLGRGADPVASSVFTRTPHTRLADAVADGDARSARARAANIYILRGTCLFCRRGPNRREVLRSAEIECVVDATVYVVSARPRGTIPAPGRVRAGSPRCRSGAIFPGQALPRRDRAVELVTRRAAHREAPQAMMVLRAFRAKPHPRDRTPDTNKALTVAAGRRASIKSSTI